MSEATASGDHDQARHDEAELHPPVQSDRTITPARRSSIAELFARYALSYDEHRIDILSDCFTPDATCHTLVGTQTKARFEGITEILTGLSSVMNEQGQQQRRHVVTNIVLEDRGPDQVDALAYVLVTVGGGRGGPALGAVGTYRAVVVAAPTRWMFRELTIRLDSYAGQAPQR